MGAYDFELGQEGLDVGNGGYCVDIAMCIDVTGSMSPILQETKNNAMAFCDKVLDAMEAKDKNVEELRIKVIPFRDFGCDGAQAMADSGFFSLPDQNEEYKNYVEGLHAAGGGDEPESALEAMALAMRSDWTTHGMKRRHVIMVLTDASAVPLQDASRKKNRTYPANMPEDLGQLAEMWSGCSQDLGGMPEEKSARLVVFAPSVAPWNDMESWNNVWTAYSKAGTGLDDCTMDMAIELLVNSI